jgi:putative ATP-dependent endonuclease of the OLD family
MNLLENKLSIRNYKSFGDKWAEIDGISPITLIVGRNNTGKSALLDLIGFMANNVDIPQAQWRNKQQAERTAFGTNVGGGKIAGGPLGGSHWDQVGRHLVGLPITLRRHAAQALPSIVKFDKVPDIALKAFGGVKEDARLPALINMLSPAIRHEVNPLQGKSVRRLLAERDIRPEGAANDIRVESNGTGATNAFARIITRTRYDSDIVRVRLRDRLNKICEPDASIAEILVKENDTGSWEIFFEERLSGTVPLAHSESGLKTILLVLLLPK